MGTLFPEGAKEDVVHFMLKCTAYEQLRRSLLEGLKKSDWNSAQVDWANMSPQQKAVAMLGFGEEPIPDAEFNNALRYVRDAYKKRGERLESLTSEESSDEDREGSGEDDEDREDSGEGGEDRDGSGEGGEEEGGEEEGGGVDEEEGSKSNVFLNMMAAARGKKLNKRQRRGKGGEFDKKEARGQKQVLVCSLTSLCLPGHCSSGSEIESIVERRQKQISGFHFTLSLFNPSQSVVASRPSGGGANDSRIRARSN